MDIAPEIKAELARRGASRAALASAIGLSRQGLSNKMNGHREFTMTEVEKIASSFGIPASELVARAERAASAGPERTPVAAALPERADEEVLTCAGPAVVLTGAVVGLTAAPGAPSVEDPEPHETDCESCLSLTDSAERLRGDEGPAAHRASAEEVA